MNFQFTDAFVSRARAAREARARKADDSARASSTSDDDDDDGDARDARDGARARDDDDDDARDGDDDAGGAVTRRVARTLERWRANDASLLMFRRDGATRRFCARAIEARAFHAVVAMCVVGSSAIVAVVKPARDGAAEATAATAANYVVAGVFAAEALVKSVALGFALGEGAYLTTNWHRFDFTLVVLSLMLMPIGGSQVVTVRLLRSLYAFKLFAKYRSARLAMKTIARALPLLGDVLLFLLWFLIFFAVSGVTMFGGRMTGRWYGTPPDQATNASYVFPVGTGSETCANLVGAWMGALALGAEGTYPNEYDSTCNYKEWNTNRSATEWCCDSGIEPYDGFLSFANAGRSSIVALNGMTIDGWNELLNPTAYAVGYPAAFLWFIVVVLMGGFFMMELFTSVICATLTQMGIRDEDEAPEDSSQAKTEKVLESLDDETALSRGESDGRGNNFHKNGERFFRLFVSDATRQMCWKIAEDRRFDASITVVIIFNTILMMSQHHAASSGFVKASEILEYVFLGCFAVEMAIKHIGYGFRGYWSSKQNVVDGLIVFTGVISTAVTSQGVSASFIRLLRIGRALRTFRVIRNNREFRKIISSAYLGFQDMWPFLIVWLLFQVIFAIYGFQLFTGLGALDDERLTFRNFLRSALTLFVVATGEDSFVVAWNTMVASGNDVVVLYTIAWIFLSTVILSLVLGILIDSCSLVDIEEEQRAQDELGDGRLRSAIERAGDIVLDPNRKAKRVLQNMTFAANAFRSTLRKHARSKRGDSIKDRGDTSFKFNLLDAARKQECAEQAIQSQAKKSLKTADGSTPTAISSLLAALKPPDHGGKLAQVKKDRLRKQTVEDVAACRIFLDSIGFKLKTPAQVLTISEHALKEAQLRLTPKFVEYQDYQDKAFGVTSSIKRSIRHSMTKRFAAQNNRLSIEDKSKEDEHVVFDAHGPWAATITRSISSRVKKQSSEIPGVIVTKDGDFIPLYDDTIPVERYKYLVHKIVSHNLFENAILCMIIAGSVLLATETKTWPVAGSHTAKVYTAVDITFTTLFGAEMVLKLFAYGLYERPTAYLKNSFNILDGVVVFTSIISLTAADDGSGSVRALRLLRIMRPLRSIRRFPGLRLVVNTVLSAIPAVSYVCFIGLVSMSIFALLGMELFMGKFWSCRVVNDASSYTTQATCEAAGGKWRNAKFNFDNFGAALLSTFLLHAGDDWQEIMWVAMDTTGVGTGLKTDNNQAAALYFVLTVAIGNFFWLNLLVTALVDNFNKMASQDKLTFVTPAQRRWQQAILRASTQDSEAWRRIVPPPGKSLWSRARLLAHHISKPKKFAYFILVVVCANLIELLTQTANMSSSAEYAHFCMSIAFTAVYSLEMMLLLMAQGRTRYFRNYWNWLDAFVVVVSIVQAIGQSLNAGGVMNYLQLVRLLRLLKLVKAHSGLRSLFNTFIMSLPGVGNVAALSSLAIFSYAIMGVSLFGDETGPFEGGVLSKYSNFQRFTTACSSLIGVYTGGWVGTFGEVYQTEACLRTEAPFMLESSIDCSYNAAAVPYFISFVIISIFLLGNLFVAIILERFSVSADDEGLYDTEEVVEIIKHTIQLRRLAIRIKKKVVRSREPGGALFDASTKARSVIERFTHSAQEERAVVKGHRGGSVARDHVATLAAFETNGEQGNVVPGRNQSILDLAPETDVTAEREVRPEPEPELELEPPEPLRGAAFFGENRFESRRAYASSTDADSDDDHYAFEMKDPSSGRQPGLNTPNDGLSEREPSELAYSMGESYDAEESASDEDRFAQSSFSPESYRFNASGEEATRVHYARHSDYLYDFRDADDSPERRRKASSLLGSETSDDGATGGQTSDAVSDGEFAKLSFRL